MSSRLRVNVPVKPYRRSLQHPGGRSGGRGLGGDADGEGVEPVMNMRHLSAAETKIIGAIVEEAGAVEVLRLLGTIIANEHPAWEYGTKYRSEIFEIAKRLGNDQRTNRPQSTLPSKSTE